MDQYALQRIEREESLRALEEFQREAERAGQVPRASKLPLRRYRRFLEVVGGMTLGVVVSGLTALFNFIIFTWVLHIGS